MKCATSADAQPSVLPKQPGGDKGEGAGESEEKCRREEAEKTRERRGGRRPELTRSGILAGEHDVRLARERAEPMPTNTA